MSLIKKTLKNLEVEFIQKGIAHRDKPLYALSNNTYFLSADFFIESWTKKRFHQFFERLMFDMIHRVQGDVLVYNFATNVHRLTIFRFTIKIDCKRRTYTVKEIKF